MQNYNSATQKTNEADKVENVTLKIESRESIGVDRSIKILDLQNFQIVQQICHDAMVNKKFVGITGDPGMGKTTGLRYFQSHHDNVFIVTVTASMTVRDFWITVFETICDYRVKEANIIGASLFNNPDQEFKHWDRHTQLESLAKESLLQMTNIRNNPNIHFIIKQIIKNINTTGGLLIFDEGGKVKTTRFLEMIHELRDATMDHAGIVIAGPEYFKRQLQVWVNKSVNGIPELWSRIQYWSSLNVPSRDDIKAFCNAYGITSNEVIKEMQTTRNYRTLYNKVIDYLERQLQEQNEIK